MRRYQSLRHILLCTVYWKTFSKYVINYQKCKPYRKEYNLICNDVKSRPFPFQPYYLVHEKHRHKHPEDIWTQRNGLSISVIRKCQVRYVSAVTWRLALICEQTLQQCVMIICPSSPLVWEHCCGFYYLSV